MEAGSMLYNLYTYKGFDASYIGWQFGGEKNK